MGRRWRSPRTQFFARSSRRRGPRTKNSWGGLRRSEGSTKLDLAVWLRNYFEFDSLWLGRLLHAQGCPDRFVRHASADANVAVHFTFAAKTDFASRKRAGNGCWASTSALVDSQKSRYSPSVHFHFEFVTKKIPGFFYVFHIRVDSRLRARSAVAQLVREKSGADECRDFRALTQSHLCQLPSYRPSA